MNRTGMNSRIILVFSTAVALYCALFVRLQQGSFDPKDAGGHSGDIDVGYRSATGHCRSSVRDRGP